MLHDDFTDMPTGKLIETDRVLSETSYKYEVRDLQDGSIEPIMVALFVDGDHNDSVWFEEVGYALRYARKWLARAQNREIGYAVGPLEDPDL